MIQLENRNKLIQIGAQQVNSEKVERALKLVQKESETLEGSLQKSDKMLKELTVSVDKVSNDCVSLKNNNNSLRKEISVCLQYEGEVRGHLRTSELELNALLVRESDLQASNNLMES